MRRHRDVTGQTLGGFTMLQLVGRHPKPPHYFVYLMKCAACGDERLRLLTVVLKNGGCKCACRGGRSRALTESDVGPLKPPRPKASASSVEEDVDAEANEEDVDVAEANEQARLALIQRRHRAFMKASLGDERIHAERQTWE